MRDSLVGLFAYSTSRRLPSALRRRRTGGILGSDWRTTLDSQLIEERVTTTIPREAAPLYNENLRWLGSGQVGGPGHGDTVLLFLGGPLS